MSTADSLRRFLAGLELAPTMVGRVKPRAALVLPAWLDVDDPQHRDDLELAAAVLQVLHPRYRIELVTGDDAATLEGCAFALCLLDRELAACCSARLPTRLLGRDTLAFDRAKWRLAFRRPEPELEAASRPAAEPSGSTVVYVDHLIGPDAAARLGSALRRSCPTAELRVAADLSPAVRRPLEAAFGRAAGDLEDPGHTNGFDTFVSTDLAALQFLGGPQRRVYLSPAGGLHDVTGLSIPRHDLFLYKGEEQDPLRLSTLLLGVAREPPSAKRTYRRPLISVIVPVYNRTDDILRLAASIFRQRYANLEVLFVTNGSPPETVRAVAAASAYLIQKRIHVQTLRFERAFGTATIPRDVGCYAARGEFICFLDTDDYLEPGFFDDFLTEPMANDVIYGPKKIYRDAGRDMGTDFRFDHVFDGIGNVSQGLYELLRALGNVFQNSGVIIPREAFVRCGGIEHTLKYCEDYYLWLRLARAGLGAREHNGAVSISLHPGNNELVVGQPEWFFIARNAAERQAVV